MQFPRMTTRRLMIAVAIAGITFWVAVSFPATCYGIAVLGTLLIIPMIGASCGGYYSANRFAGCIVGGMIGVYRPINSPDGILARLV